MAERILERRRGRESEPRGEGAPPGASSLQLPAESNGYTPCLETHLWPTGRRMLVVSEAERVSGIELGDSRRVAPGPSFFYATRRVAGGRSKLCPEIGAQGSKLDEHLCNGREFRRGSRCWGAELLLPLNIVFLDVTPIFAQVRASSPIWGLISGRSSLLT